MEQIPLFAGGDLEETTPEENQALMSYVNGINDFIINEMEEEVVPSVVDKFYDPSSVDPHEMVEMELPVWKMGTAYFILRNHAADPEGDNGMIGRSMASLTADGINESGGVEDYAIDVSELPLDSTTGFGSFQ